MPRKKSGATTTGAPTWKTASPNSSTTSAPTVSACKSSSPPKLLSRPSYSVQPALGVPARRWFAGLPRTGDPAHPSIYLWRHPRPGRATMGAPSVAKLGWIENTKPADRQDFRLGNSNFAEVGVCRSYLKPDRCFNPDPKCQETRNRKAQLRISGLWAVSSPYEPV